MESIEIKKEDLETLVDIEPIGDSPGVITELGHIKHMVEKPLIPIVEELYKKNIRTVSSSANKNNVQNGYDFLPNIIVEYGSLSHENKKIAEYYGEVDTTKTMGKGDYVIIKILADKETTVSEFQLRALRIAKLFKKQPMSWAPRYSFKQLLRVYNCQEKDTKPEDFVKEGYHYDHRSGMFYLSKEHCDKFNEHAENN